VRHSAEWSTVHELPRWDRKAEWIVLTVELPLPLDAAVVPNCVAVPKRLCPSAFAVALQIVAAASAGHASVPLASVAAGWAVPASVVAGGAVGVLFPPALVAVPLAGIATDYFEPKRLPSSKGQQAKTKW